MCGLCGYLDMSKERSAEKNVLTNMTETMVYRGPDSSGYFLKDHFGLGFRRLSLIDLEGGHQPLYNEDKSIVLVCNGEVFNYLELKKDLVHKGHRFRTSTDVEVLPHLYEEYGIDLLNKLNGQFAFALYDHREQKLILARDPIGICPLFYTLVDNTLIFGSEIKAILAHPLVRREVDLVGLDQILTFPGLISPRTMFRNIKSLNSGHYIVVKDRHLEIREYWDLDYPMIGELSYRRPESYYVEKLDDILTQSVKHRLRADVPVGLYLSGGLDSSLIAAIANKLCKVGGLWPESAVHSFSIAFRDKDICESRYRGLLLPHFDTIHHETIFDWFQISDRLVSAVYHSECPLKETYNTASLALSESAKSNGVHAILTGEGADELFAGYVGYRFDQFRHKHKHGSSRHNERNRHNLETALEDELRLKLWGDENLFYERDLYSFRDTKMALYSPKVNELFGEFDCLNFDLVNKQRLRNRHFIHQRSYLDFKLRLSDHLVADHGDRMALANSVEARYPFLDIDLVEFVTDIPPEFKLNGFVEKYILKELAKGLVPPEIIDREKFAFHAPGSPYLLRQNIEWVNALLSFDLVKRQGYFNPVTVERLKKQYMEEGFKLNLPFENDLLIIVLTFGIFVKVFEMPHLN